MAFTIGAVALVYRMQNMLDTITRSAKPIPPAIPRADRDPEPVSRFRVEIPEPPAKPPEPHVPDAWDRLVQHRMANED